MQVLIGGGSEIDKLRLVDDVRPNLVIGICFSADFNGLNQRRKFFCSQILLVLECDWVAANKSDPSEPDLRPYRIFLYKMNENYPSSENFIWSTKSLSVYFS